MKNDGGAAFPGKTGRDISRGSPCGISETDTIFDNNSGMTLRDWFAGQADINISPNNVSSESAESLAGRKEPNSGVEWYEFWAEVKAKLRYIEADAMLKEREK